ncbi:MAG: 4-hydroxythreonine-4-phosphate dehydrogenase PdxA [Candidatus Omnitrophica bacterium]|nr:4-hydroxythreonine-4-phosphate dehydrogenase PdxA [Candidatus Omnitrophota bacterium]
MLKSNNKAILITMGDPAGIGAEVTAKALLKVRFPKGVEPVVIGDQAVWQKFWPADKSWPLFIHLASRARTVHRPGLPTVESGRDSLLYLEKAVELIKEGRAQALVTAPVAKEAICRFIPGFKGHTTFLARAFGLKNVEMLFLADAMKLVLVTRHVSLMEVPAMITADKVFAVIKTTYDFLVARSGKRNLKVAVLGLNPHAGENGHMGQEEIRHIKPAMKRLRAVGVDVHGPFPADTFFEPRNCHGYDLLSAMYHDQALTVLKAQYFDRLVNMTIGLPFIRTSPAHGTAFGIAGKGIADEGSMLAAIKAAVSV